MKFFLIVVLMMTLSFSCVSKTDYFTSPGSPSGQLLLNPYKPTKSLFPVRLLTINGENVANRENAVWLKPGKYDLTFSSIVDLKYTGANGINVRSNDGRFKIKDRKLTVKVEEGRRYYIAYDAHELDKSKWQPIVWKIK